MMGRACVAAGVRRPIMRESWSSASYPFVRARRPVVYWRRRLTFLKAGRGHTTSSSSAIAIAKMDQRSCSITYQLRNCVDVLPLSCASKKDLTKMESWLVP
jgi:hypothetical protein